MHYRFPAASILAFALSLGACAQSGMSPVSSTSTEALTRSVLHAHAPSIAATYTAGITKNAAIHAVVSGFDGRVWFAEFNTSKIGAITTTGVTTEYPTVANGQPTMIIRGVKALWAGGYGGALIRVLSGGAQTNYPFAGAHIFDIAIGTDGHEWFTDYGHYKFARLNSNGTDTLFGLGTGTSPGGLVRGPDGNFWICDIGTHKILKVNTSGVVLGRYGGLTAGDQPQHIVAAPDKNLYFTQAAYGSTTDEVGRITTAGVVTELASLPKGSYPDIIAIGKDNNVYFSLHGYKGVGEIVTSTGHVTLWPLPFAHDTGAEALGAGPDGRLWIAGYQTFYAVNY